MDENYTNVHRTFLQMCANHGCLQKERAIVALRRIIGKYGNGPEIGEEAGEPQLKEVIKAINEKIAAFEQKISLIEMEWDLPEKEFVVFANTMQNTAKLGIPYNEAECNYFKLLLEQMFQYETYSIPNMIALNLSSSTVTSSQAARTKKVTKQRAQDLLEEWVSRGYFVNANERIQLGPRSIGEFGEVLSTEYAEYVKKCYLCKNVSFKAVNCENGDCDVSLDRECANKYLKKAKKCPKCKTAWRYAEDDE